MTDRPKLTDILQSPSRVPGWPIKACAGLLCVGLLALALPLGLLGLALLGYVWLILRVKVARTGSAADPVTTADSALAVVAPIDGRVVYIDTEKEDQCRIFLAPDLFDSHLHYAPVHGQTEDITWIDGSFSASGLDLPPSEQRVRREILFSTPAGHQVMLTQYGAQTTRLIQCFLREGRWVSTSDCIGLALFGGVVAVSFSGAPSPSLTLGQRCLAAQTRLGQTG